MEIIVDHLRRIVAARPYRRDVARYLAGLRPWRRLCDDVDAELLRILCKRHRCIVALQVIGTAIDDEFRLLTVLLANAVAVRIHPARSLKDLHCFVHAVVRFLQIVIRPRKSFRKIHRRLSEAAERILDDRLAVDADVQCLADGRIARHIVADQHAVFVMLRLLRHIDAEAVDGVHHYQFHIRHACRRKFGRCKDEIDLSGLRCCKHSIIAQIQRRHLFQLRLFSVIIFVRLHHKLLFLLERDDLPGTAADRRRRIPFFIGVLRHNAEGGRRFEENRPRA